MLSLKAANPGGIYTKGWMNRLEDLRSYSSTLLGKTMEATKETITNATEVVKKSLEDNSGSGSNNNSGVHGV